jgi:hypothetical protein
LARGRLHPSATHPTFFIIPAGKPLISCGRFDVPQPQLPSATTHVAKSLPDEGGVAVVECSCDRVALRRATASDLTSTLDLLNRPPIKVCTHWTIPSLALDSMAKQQKDVATRVSSLSKEGVTLPWWIKLHTLAHPGEKLVRISTGLCIAEGIQITDLSSTES